MKKLFTGLWYEITYGDNMLVKAECIELHKHGAHFYYDDRTLFKHFSEIKRQVKKPLLARRVK